MVTASPPGSPKTSNKFERKPLMHQDQPDKDVDTVTLSAITALCSCGGQKQSGTSNNKKLISSPSENEMFQHQIHHCSPPTDNRF